MESSCHMHDSNAHPYLQAAFLLHVGIIVLCMSAPSVTTLENPERFVIVQIVWTISQMFLLAFWDGKHLETVIKLTVLHITMQEVEIV